MRLFLNNKNFRYFLSSNIFGVIGTTLFNIVFLIYAQSFPNPELAVSAVIFISTIPYMLDFLFGYMSDKTHDKLKMLIRSRIFQVILYVLFSIFAGFEPTWIIFGVVLIINFLSDIIGTYNSYLELPITKNIVEQKDLTDARSVQSGMMNSVNFIGGLIGSGLIIVLNYNYALFGILNTIFFIVSFILLWINKDRLKDAIQLMNNAEKNGRKTAKGFVRRISKDLLGNLRLLITLKQIFKFTLIFAIVNLISSAQNALLLLTFVNTESLQFGTFGFTVALFESVESVGIILGALLPIAFFRRQSIELNIVLRTIITLAIIGYIVLFQEKYMLLFLTFLAGYFMGLSNPRVDSFIMISAPEKSLGSIMSIFYTLIQLTLPIGTAIFLLIANTISIQFSWLVLLIVTSLLLLYAVTLSLKNSTIPEKII